MCLIMIHDTLCQTSVSNFDFLEKCPINFHRGSRWSVTKMGDFLKSPDSCISLTNLSMVFWYAFTRGKDSLFLVSVFFFL